MYQTEQNINATGGYCEEGGMYGQCVFSKLKTALKISTKIAEGYGCLEKASGKYPCISLPHIRESFLTSGLLVNTSAGLSI